MIKSITVTNYLGESLKMELTNPYDSGFAITDITGIGPGKADINVTELTSSDGALHNSSRLVRLSVKNLTSIFQSKKS